MNVQQEADKLFRNVKLNYYVCPIKCYIRVYLATLCITAPENLNQHVRCIKKKEKRKFCKKSAICCLGGYSSLATMLESKYEYETLNYVLSFEAFALKEIR